jgi:hypothetical protein
MNTVNQYLAVAVACVTLLACEHQCRAQAFPPSPLDGVTMATPDDIANLGKPNQPHHLLVLCSPGTYSSHDGVGIKVEKHGLTCHYGFLDEAAGKPTGTIHIEIPRQI